MTTLDDLERLLNARADWRIIADALEECGGGSVCQGVYPGGYEVLKCLRRYPVDINGHRNRHDEQCEPAIRRFIKEQRAVKQC